MSCPSYQYCLFLVQCDDDSEKSAQFPGGSFSEFRRIVSFYLWSASLPFCVVITWLNDPSRNLDFVRSCVVKSVRNPIFPASLVICSGFWIQFLPSCPGFQWEIRLRWRRFISESWPVPYGCPLMHLSDICENLRRDFVYWFPIFPSPFLSRCASTFLFTRFR